MGRQMRPHPAGQGMGRPVPVALSPDWPALAGDVAVALLGEPTRRSARELRYGRRGSLVVRPTQGTWYDHEAGVGGGVIDLVMHKLGGSRQDALEWLAEAGFVSTITRTGRSGVRPATRPSSRPRAVPDTAEPRRALAAALWQAATCADDTPGRAYLAARRAWPPASISWPLPPSVRWLPRERAPGRDETTSWYGLPDRAAGALVFAIHAQGGTTEAEAVTLLCVSAAAERIEWPFKSPAKVRTAGSGGPAAVFETQPGDDPSGPLHVCEGEVDALALALAPWCETGRIVARRGTSGMLNAAQAGTGSVTLHCDGDPAGRKAAAAAQAHVQAQGRHCRIEPYEDSDPADRLARWIIEAAEEAGESETSAWRFLCGLYSGVAKDKETA